MRLSKKDFGEMADGRPVIRYVITNERGMQISLLNYGATLGSVILTEGKNKTPLEMTINLVDWKELSNKHPYMGVTVGRVANRIRAGRFSLNQTEYQLDKNENDMNHVHGGKHGLHTRLWERETIEKIGSLGVRFSCLSRDGEGGYPGNLKAYATYELTEENEIHMTFEAVTDAPTPVNLTNHTFWNLSGGKSQTIEKHKLEIFADHYLPLNEARIPVGVLSPVKKTPFDFRKSQKLKLKNISNLDQTFPLREKGDHLKRAAILTDTGSKRSMEVWTTEPGIQVNTGNNLHEVETAHGRKFEKHAGVCLSSQKFPNSVNEPSFPPCILYPGGHYFHQSVYRFSG